jgi:hypothetical protein
MNKFQQIKMKSQIRIDQAIDYGSEFLRDIWLQVVAEREARIRLMTDGCFERHQGVRPWEGTPTE